MCKKTKARERNTAEVAGKYGAKYSHTIVGRNHNKMVLINPATGKSQYVVVAKTPSDHRAEKNHLATVKYVAMGLAA